MEKKEIDRIIKELDFYSKRMTMTHIETLDGKVYNGVITEVCADFFIIYDRFLGEMPLFFVELKKVEPFKPKLKVDSK